MSYRVDPIREHAWLTELALEVEDWRNAEHRVIECVRRAIADGARAHVLAEQLDVSRATLYRWLAATATESATQAATAKEHRR